MAKICPDHKLEAARNLFDANPDEGIELLQALVRQYPSDLDVRFSLGRAHLESSEADEALEHLEFVVERKKTANTLSLLSSCYAMLGIEKFPPITVRNTHGLRMLESWWRQCSPVPTKSVASLG
jgi:tetratricopeptide (TPR) repeat protein